MYIITSIFIIVCCIRQNWPIRSLHYFLIYIYINGSEDKDHLLVLHLSCI